MKTHILLIISLLMFTLLGNSTFAQIDVKGKVEDKTTSRVDQRLDEGIDKTLDGIENGIKSVFKKKDKKNKDKSENDEMDDNSEMIGSETESEESIDSKPIKEKTDDKPKLESFTEYDFIPGDQILFFDDFSQDAVGDFPALWTTNGGGEVKTVNLASGNWFHMNIEDAVYCYTKSIAFPQNFIMEFDVIPDGNFSNGYTITFYEDPDNVELTADLYPGTKGLHISFDEGNWYTKGYNNAMDIGGWIEGRSTTKPVVYGQVNHVIIWVQNRRLRMYHQGAKVLDMPTNIHAGTKFNRFRFSGWNTYSTPYVSNLKITTATPDMRSKLLTEGKLTSYGIYFDSGKDIVKPESYGSVKEIAAVLKENPEVKIMIVGHTDSDGDDAMNLDLSKRRAANVKNYLVKEFGIGAERISTDGMGETQPLVPNSSVENKAKNRRVEFIKQ
ncbi:MAG TPA: OmpA family protein [Bacteroidales bacterium]|nr:OmpA family protein [Bacteroidales bacterium]HOL98211.1 OmpA family protein [Bacteroidales bacterium]HUM32594.1 OmpA family protein [Bacteroidales bacterium]